MPDQGLVCLVKNGKDGSVDDSNNSNVIEQFAQRTTDLQRKLDLATDALQSLTTKVAEYQALLLAEKERADKFERKYTKVFYSAFLL